MINVDKVRSQISVVSDWIYLSTFEQGALPVRSGRAMSELIRMQVKMGSARKTPPRNYLKYFREKIRQMLKVNVAIDVTSNKSQAIAFCMQTVKWERGGSVLTDSLANHHLMQSQVGIITLPNDIDPITMREALEQTERPQLVFVQSINPLNGNRRPLKELGEIVHEFGAIFMVDISDLVGSFQLLPDQENIDILLFEAHKWLLCPNNLCAIYSSFDHSDFKRKSTVRKIAENVVLPSINDLVGAYHSLNLISEYEILDIQEYIGNLVSYLSAGLVEMDYELVSSRDPTKTSAMVCLKHPRLKPEELKEKLQTNYVTSSILGECNVLSPHIFNRADEIDKTLDILSTF